MMRGDVIGPWFAYTIHPESSGIWPIRQGLEALIIKKLIMVRFCSHTLATSHNIQLAPVPDMLTPESHT